MVQAYTLRRSLIAYLETSGLSYRRLDVVEAVEPSHVVLCDPVSVLPLLQHPVDTLIIVLSDAPDIKEAQYLLSRGVLGYADTSLDLRTLRQAIFAVHNGRTWLLPALA